MGIYSVTHMGKVESRQAPGTKTETLTQLDRFIICAYMCLLFVAWFGLILHILPAVSIKLIDLLVTSSYLFACALHHVSSTIVSLNSQGTEEHHQVRVPERGQIFDFLEELFGNVIIGRHLWLLAEWCRHMPTYLEKLDDCSKLNHAKSSVIFLIKLGKSWKIKVPQVFDDNCDEGCPLASFSAKSSWCKPAHFTTTLVPFHVAK